MKKYWVLEKTDDKSKIIIDKETVTLKNGLIERVVACRKGTVSFNREGENSLLSLGGSDIELTLNGREIDFYKEAEFLSAESSDVIPYVDYTSEKGVPFPPKGAGVTLTYKLGDLRAEVIYEIYDGIPVICKRLYIYNESKKAVCVNRYVLDRLAVSEEKYSEMYAETSYNGGCALNTNRTLSVKHDGETFRVTFDMGPDAEIKRENALRALEATSFSILQSIMSKSL